MTHRLLRYCAGIAAGLLCLWWAVGSPAGKLGGTEVAAAAGMRLPATSAPLPLEQRRAADPASAALLARKHLLPVQRHQLLKGAVLLERRVLGVEAATGVQQVAELYRTGFKYPLIRVEQWLRPAVGAAAPLVQRELLSVADHAMVRFPTQMTEDDIARWAERRGLVVRKRLRMQRLHLIAKESTSLSAADTVMQAFSQDFPQQQAVVQPVAERDYLYFTTTVPNDAHFIHLWGLHNTGQTAGTVDADIDAPEAWQYTTGSRSVRVGIIDTGLDRNHPDLAANVWTNPGEVQGNGLDDDGNGLVDDTVGWDFYSDDADPSDGEGHGTHCAGTLGAVGNNTTGVTGVCWQVGLVGIRFLGPGGGSTSDAIEAVHYATRLGCSLTSNSWGGGGSSTLLQDAIVAAGAAGIPFIAAAGNSGQNTDTSGSHFPSGYSSENIIAVGAMDAAEQVAGFSNFGPTSVDLFAPGVSIYSSFPGADYQTLSGTSMATPHVAGAVALLRSLVPSLSVAELKSQLLASTDALPVYAGRCVSGGRLNLQRYLEPYSGPRPVITEATVAEAAGGNADGVLNPGEPLQLSLALTNRGALATGPLTVTLTSLSTASKVQITRGVLTLPSLSAGQSLVPSQMLELTTTLPLTTPHTEQLRLALSYGSPASEIVRTVPLVIHRTVRLAGRVTNAEDGSAIPTATVMAEGPRSLSVKVAADGSFDLRVVDGSYSVSAVAPGFLRAVATQHTVPPDALNLSIALLRPVLRIEPSSLSVQLLAGDKSEQTVTLRNPGTAELEWSAELTGDTLTPTSATASGIGSSLQEALAKLDAGHARISTLIPRRYDFTEGVVGSSILDGGEDMYDSGNALHTHAATPIPYSDGVVRADASVGSAGRYFTRKHAGLFVFAADLKGVSSFSIRGNLGADGAGKVSGAVLNRSHRGTLYKGFVKRVYAAGDPSVNHLILLPTQTRLTHSFPENTDDDLHTVQGLAADTRLYYLCFSSVEGGFVSDAQCAAIMDAFLQTVEDGSGSWMTFTPQQGRLAAGGGEQQMQLSLQGQDLPPGSYGLGLDFSTNIPDSPKIRLPVQVQVTAAPGIAVSPAVLDYGHTPVGQRHELTVQVRNAGSQDLEVTQLRISGADAADFTLAEAAGFRLSPGASRAVVVQQRSTRRTTVQATLELSSTDPTDPVLSVPLRAVGSLPPLATLSPLSVAVTLKEGQSVQRIITLGNRGAGPLDWELEVPATSAEWLTLPDPLRSGTVAPGSSQQLRLAMVTRGLRPGRYATTLVLTTRDARLRRVALPVVMTLTAAPILTAAPSSLRFPTVFSHSSATARVTVSNDGSAPMVLYGCLPVSGPFTCVSSFPQRLAPGQSTELEMKFSPREPGRYASQMLLSSNSSERRIYLPVSAEALLGPTLEIAPTQLSFSADPGTVNPQRITLRNIGAATLHWSGPALQGEMLLRAQPEAGSLTPGSSTTVDLLVHTNSAPAGRRSMQWEILTNDPTGKSTRLPIVVSISRKARLVATPAALTFANTWRGDSSTLAVSLQNTGNLALRVTSLSGLQAPFRLLSPPALPYLLPPGASLDLSCAYEPTTLGQHSGLLSAGTDLAGSLLLPLSGSASLGPRISVQPGAVQLTVKPGTTVKQLLTMENTGGDVLRWRAVATRPILQGAAAAPSTRVTAGLSLTGLRVGLSSLTSSVAVDLRSRGAGLITLLRPLTQERLQVLDLLVLGDSELDLSADEISAVRGWLSQGRGLLLQGETAASMPALQALQRDTGISSSFSGALENYTATGISAHPTTAGITALRQVDAGGKLIVSAPAAAVVARSTGGVILAAASRLGEGRLFAIGNDVMTPSDAQGRSFANLIFSWLAEHQLGFTAALKTLSGNIQPGQKTSNEATFSIAAGQPAGTALGSILISSDDPEQPTVNLPVTLTVQSGGVLSSSLTTVAFAPTFRGYSRDLTLPLQNVGNAPLTLTALRCTDAAVSLRNGLGLPLTLAPGQSGSVSLRFSPTRVGLLSAVLSAESDALNAFTLNVTGTCNDPPVAELTTSSLQLSVQAGASLSYDLPLSNTGGSVLNYSVQRSGDNSTFTSVSPSTGSVSVGASQTLRVTVTPGFRPVGDYTGSLTLSSNDPARSILTLPLVITVQASAVGAASTSSMVAAAVPASTPGGVLQLLPDAALPVMYALHQSATAADSATLLRLSASSAAVLTQCPLPGPACSMAYHSQEQRLYVISGAQRSRVLVLNCAEEELRWEGEWQAPHAVLSLSAAEKGELLLHGVDGRQTLHHSSTGELLPEQPEAAVAQLPTPPALPLAAVLAYSPTGHLAYTASHALVVETGEVAFSLNTVSSVVAASADGQHVLQYDAATQSLICTEVPPQWLPQH